MTAIIATTPMSPEDVRRKNAQGKKQSQRKEPLHDQAGATAIRGDQTGSRAAR